MHLLRFIPIKLMLFLVLGILLGHYVDIGIPLSFGLTTGVMVVTAFLFLKNKKTALFGLVALCTATGIGLISISLWKPKNTLNHYSHQNLEKAMLCKIKIREVLKSSSFSHRYFAEMISMENKAVSGKILVTASNDTNSLKLLVDQEVYVMNVLLPITKPSNPHQFNYKEYLATLGIYHQIRLLPTNHFASKKYATTVLGLAASLRSKIITKLQHTQIGAEELSVIQALLLGERTAISEETYNAYKNAGAVHILAVSGLHIGILLLLLQFLFRPLEKLPNGKTIKLFSIVILLWCFALLAGFSASIVRAVTMFSFVAYALYLNRPSNTFNILALSLFFILLVINPMLVFHAGFQMSYAAVFAIVWLYPLLQKLWFPKNLVTRKIWQLLSVSIAAQLGILPISLFYFHQFPCLFFISNLLIVPFLGIILGMGITVIGLALCNSLPSFLAFWYNWIIQLMNSIIEWVAEQEAFIFRNISFDGLQLILAYLIIITATLLCITPSYKRIIFLFTCVIGFQTWILYSHYNSTKKDVLIVAHQTKNTILLYQQGKELEVSTANKNTTTGIVTDYIIGERTNNSNYRKLKNSYTFKGKSILIVDSLGMYSKQNFDVILLTQSPKINLDRLLNHVKPKLLIVDGSNYTTIAKHWKKTAEKRKLPFHFTKEEGAYYFD